MKETKKQQLERIRLAWMQFKAKVQPKVEQQQQQAKFLKKKQCIKPMYLRQEVQDEVRRLNALRPRNTFFHVWCSSCCGYHVKRMASRP